MSDLITAIQKAIADICAARLCEVNSMSSRQEMLRLMIQATDTLRSALAQQEQEQYKLRIRATNKSLTMPTAQIVSVTKSGTTTGAFVTETPHKLVPGDLAVYYGPSDTAHDGNQDQEPLCKGIPRRGCNYLAACDTVCNKCGKVHAHHQMVAQFHAAQQQEREPVAWMSPASESMIGKTDENGSAYHIITTSKKTANNAVPLFTHPPRREPLTVTELQQALVDADLVDPDAIDDPDRYDAGSTVAQIDALHSRLMQTTPPRREWVSLTEEERQRVYDEAPAIEGVDYIPHGFARAIEQALKEKNT